MAGMNIFPDGIPKTVTKGINIFPDGIPETAPVAPETKRSFRGQYKDDPWVGPIKAGLKSVGDEIIEGVKATPETFGALATGIPLWAVGKLRGTGELMRGNTVEQAREVEQDIAEKGIQPKTKAGKSAVGMVGKVMDVVTWPARKAGETLEEMGHPRAGYLTELGGELATFKGIHGLKTKVLGEPLKGTNIIKAEKQSKLTPLEKAYEVQKDIWIGKKQRRMLEADIESRLMKKEIKKSVGKKQSKAYDEAIQVYIDLKNHPDHLQKYYGALTKAQKKTVDLAQNLPDEIKLVAEEIAQSYQKIGEEALDASVIRNMIENYAGRQWDLGPGKSVEATRKFGTTTGHAKARRLGTILEGWAEGYDLKVKSGTENLRIYKHEIVKTLGDKKFVDELRKIKDLDGNKLLSTQQLEGYVPVKHPNMTAWEWAGKIDKGKTYGKNFFATEDGALFEKRKLYAPKREAKNINNILGISALAEIRGFKGATKFNAIAKAWILQSSLFHHQAFMRSNYLPFGVKGKVKTPRQTYKEGIKSIEKSDPVLMHGVEKGGLTLGLKQDWQESLLRESTFLGRQLDKVGATRVAKNWITKFRESQADFLFGEFGAGLKAKAYLLEFRNQMEKYPNANPDIVAKRVGNIINDDFGGLNLARMGRNPTIQHMMQLFLLAPDWTESNVRSMVKAMKNMTGDQAELHMYRKFWGGVVVKSMGVTALANYALSGGDVNKMKDNYKKAWESGNMNWMKMDITPIYEGAYGMFGLTPSGRRKYWGVQGHFQDPVKFLAHPIKSAKHKQSVVAGIGFEAFSGTDYTGARRFTTFKELLQGEGTVKWGTGGVVDYDQLPSYALSQLMGTQPIQAQAFMAWMAGEQEGFDALSQSFGLRTTTTYEKKKSMKKGLKKLKGFR